MPALFACLALLSNVAGATEPTGAFLNLSLPGDGTTPSIADEFERGARQAKGGSFGASASSRGDASWSTSVPLPPALLAPSVSVSYSSAGGQHSVVGRGFSLDVGMTIDEPTGGSAAAWRDLPGVRFLRGGGLDGLLVPDGLGGWDYLSQSPSHVLASLDDGGRVSTTTSGPSSSGA